MRVGAVIVVSDNMFCTEEVEKLVKTSRPILFERVILNFQRIGIKDIVLVAGKHKALMEKILQHNGITFLGESADAPEGFANALKVGLRYLSECDRIFVSPMDVPFWNPDTATRLLKEDGAPVIPLNDYKEGYPVCIDREFREELLALEEDFTREIPTFLRTQHVTPVYVSGDDRGIMTRVCTEEEYEHFRIEFDHAQKVYPGVKVRLENKRPFFGPGTVTLLRQIDRIGSVREACAKTGMSYSKGWKLIKVAEEESGYQLVERTTGGKNGGEAYVTERGKQLLTLFEEYTTRMEKAAEEIYKEIFLDSDLF